MWLIGIFDGDEILDWDLIESEFELDEIFEMLE